MPERLLQDAGDVVSNVGSNVVNRGIPNRTVFECRGIASRAARLVDAIEPAPGHARRSWTPSSASPCRRWETPSGTESAKVPKARRDGLQFVCWGVSWRASARSSSTPHSSGAARSVVTSRGRSRPAYIASNNLVAAGTLRRFDTYTLMTWPC